jgi:hypothetical protein
MYYINDLMRGDNYPDTGGHARPFVPERCFYKIRRGDHDAFAEAFYRCSYLAKVRGKGYGGSCANTYSGSRVRLKNVVFVLSDDESGGYDDDWR